MDNDSDEIRLDVLAYRILKRWKLCLVIFSFGIIVTASFLAMSVIMANKTLHQEIRLFGIDDRYPNGVPFQRTDFLEPDILSELFASVGLEGIDPKDYTSILSIQPSKTDVSYMRHKFDIQAKFIKENKDGLQELNQLATERDDAIASVNAGKFTLQVNHDKFGLNKDIAKNILQEWPRIWERYVIDNYRVVSDLSLKSMSIVTGTDLSVPENTYYANQQLNYMEQTLSDFAADPRFKRLQSNRGRTPIEVLNGIHEYRAVFFTPVYASILSINTPLSEFYLSDQKLRIDELNKQIDSLQSIINDVHDVNIGLQKSGNNNQNSDADIIEIGDGTLNDIVGLVKAASLQQYLTNTLDKRHELVVERSRIEKELQQINENELLSPEFVATVSRIFGEIVDEHADFLRQAEQRALDSRMSLFTIQTDAFEIGGGVHPKWMKILAIPCLGMVIVLMVLVLIPLRREHGKTN